MADWVCAKGPATVLDPALGTGVLARAVARRLPGAEITGFEVDPRAADAAARALTAVEARARIRVADYLTADPAMTFDAVIANPPYLKRQDFPGAAAHIARVGRKTGIALTGLTNAYAVFLLDACARLNRGGRAAFLIPAEWMNANFGAPIRRHLVESGLLRTVICLSHEGGVFEGALTTACVVLMERGGAPGMFRLAYADPGWGPRLEEALGAGGERLRVRDADAAALIAAPKWDALLRGADAAAPDGFVPLGRLATTRRGLATGANALFHTSLAAARAAGIRDEHLIPCAGKHAASGMAFGPEDLTRLIGEGRPTHLISLRGALTPEEAAWVRAGEDAGVSERYICRMRRPWYAQETPRVAPVWAAVFGRGRMRFMRNRAGAAHLTTFHGVYPERRDALFLDALTSALNSDAVQGLMRAHTRVYGGGLGKAEPRDLLAMPVPDLRACGPETLEGMAALVRGEAARGWGEKEQARADALVAQAAREAFAEGG